MARNAQDWAQRPKPCIWLTTWTPRLYTDPGLFRRGGGQDLRSHLDHRLPRERAAGDVRLPDVPATQAGRTLVLVRGDDGQVRVAHRIISARTAGASSVQSRPASAQPHLHLPAPGPSTAGATAPASRAGKKGFQDRLDPRGRQACGGVRASIGYGGFVWVNLDDEAPPLPEFHRRRPGHPSSLTMREAAGGLPLPPRRGRHELQAVARHEQRVLSRLHALLQPGHRHTWQPGYFERRYQPFPNGHASVG